MHHLKQFGHSAHHDTRFIWCSEHRVRLSSTSRALSALAQRTPDVSLTISKDGGVVAGEDAAKKKFTSVFVNILESSERLGQNVNVTCCEVAGPKT